MDKPLKLSAVFLHNSSIQLRRLKIYPYVLIAKLRYFTKILLSFMITPTLQTTIIY